MFNNFFKTTFRNLLKNKSYVIINLVGLGLTLACCIVGYLNFKYAADFDKNHENHARIFKVHVNKNVQNRNVPFGITPLPLGHAIKDELTGVSHYSRYAETGLVMKKDLKILNRAIVFAEEDFFEMFTFPFKYGSKESFLDPGNIILTSEQAEVYFGDQDPVGEIVTLIHEEGEQFSFIVGGVLEKIPQNSSLRFHAITHFENFLKIRNSDNNKWSWFISATFFMTESEDFPQHVVDHLNQNYIEIQNEARDDWKVGNYYLERLTTLGKNAQDIRSNWLSEPPPPPAVIAPLIMAILMLLIACFNFTNTSIATSSKRLKEIGVRKVMGSTRRQLIAQFMGENLVLSVFAMLAALGIAYFLVPLYSAMWEFIDLELSLTSNPGLYIFLFGLLVFTSVLAGAYPSLYISSYQPVKILRGSVRLGGTSPLSRTLLGAQYALTVLALIGSLAFVSNAKYQETLDMGFEKGNVITVRVENQSDYERFKNQVDQMPEVVASAGTSNSIGYWNYGRTLRNGEQEIESDMMDFGLEYKDLMDLEITKGRYFEEDLYEQDRLNSIVVNERMVEEFGWEDPIGQVLQVDDSTRLSVIGVMKNIHMWGFWDPIDPTGIRLANKDYMNFVVVKTNPGKLVDTYDALESKWYEISPNTPFSGRYMDNVLKESELVNSNISTMFIFLGLLALVLSTIGLYTLVSLNIIKRIKEIGIRKVLGASLTHIVTLMNRQFFWILVISAVIGTGLSYYAIDALMASIWAYYQAMSVFTVAVPLSFLFFIALSTASGKILTAAVRNPVDSLRYE